MLVTVRNYVRPQIVILITAVPFGFLACSRSGDSVGRFFTGLLSAMRFGGLGILSIVGTASFRRYFRACDEPLSAGFRN